MKVAAPQFIGALLCVNAKVYNTAGKSIWFCMIIGDGGVIVAYLHGSFHVMLIVRRQSVVRDEATVGLPVTTRNDSVTGVVSRSKV